MPLGRHHQLLVLPSQRQNRHKFVHAVDGCAERLTFTHGMCCNS